jgi:hypothetical protein
MELRNLHHIINTHLKDNSLAEAHFSEEIFQDSVIVEHPNHKTTGSYIVITKSMGCWHLEYEKQKGKGVAIEMKIELSDKNEDIDEIINFINNHTMQGEPQVAETLSEEQKN